MLQPFIAANKAVFGAMYASSTSTFCASSIESGYTFIKKTLQLDAWVEFCRPPNFVSTTASTTQQLATTLLPTTTQQSATTTTTATTTVTPSPTTTYQRRTRPPKYAYSNEEASSKSISTTTLIVVVVVAAAVGIALLVAATIALVVYKRTRGPTVNKFRNSRQLCEVVDASALYDVGSNGVTPSGSTVTLMPPPAPTVEV